MVTITFSGDALEVLNEMRAFMKDEKPSTPMTATPKENMKPKVAALPKKAKQDAAPKVETPKTPKVEPEKVEEAPKKVEEAPKKEAAPKVEPKQDEAPMTEEQCAELRTLCMNYCKKVPDGKERIKQLLKGKGCNRVTDLKQKDIPEFKALVQI